MLNFLMCNIMEKKIEILVEKSGILDRIYLESSYYAGKRTGDLVNYDRVSAIAEDAEYLEVLIGDVAVEVAAWLGNRLVSAQVGREQVSYEAAGECDVVLAAAAVENCIAAEVLRRWLFMAGEEVTALAAEVEAKRLLLQTLLPEPEPLPADPGSPKIASPRWYPSW